MMIPLSISLSFSICSTVAVFVDIVFGLIFRLMKLLCIFESDRKKPRNCVTCIPWNLNLDQLLHKWQGESKANEKSQTPDQKVTDPETALDR